MCGSRFEGIAADSGPHSNEKARALIAAAAWATRLRRPLLTGLIPYFDRIVGGFRQRHHFLCVGETEPTQAGVAWIPGLLRENQSQGTTTRRSGSSRGTQTTRPVGSLGFEDRRNLDALVQARCRREIRRPCWLGQNRHLCAHRFWPN